MLKGMDKGTNKNEMKGNEPGPVSSKKGKGNRHARAGGVKLRRRRGKTMETPAAAVRRLERKTEKVGKKHSDLSAVQTDRFGKLIRGRFLEGQERCGKGKVTERRHPGCCATKEKK